MSGAKVSSDIEDIAYDLTSANKADENSSKSDADEDNSCGDEPLANEDNEADENTSESSAYENNSRGDEKFLS